MQFMVPATDDMLVKPYTVRLAYDKFNTLPTNT